MAESLYQGMDRAATDRQFNLRARWPEHGAYFERWAKDSAAVRDRLPARLDLAYGASPNCGLDYFPAPRPGAAEAHLALVLHCKQMSWCRNAEGQSQTRQHAFGYSRGRLATDPSDAQRPSHPSLLATAHQPWYARDR